MTAAANAEWDAFVANSPQGSPFATSWWLDTVAPGRWRTNELRDATGAIVAGWPTVVRTSRFGDVHVGAPLTPNLGPMFAPVASEAKRLSTQVEQVEELLQQMRPFAHIEARCHPNFDYWTPLRWNGFTQTSFYTWRLEDLSDLDATFAGMRDSVRRQVRKARKLGLVVSEGTIDDFLPLHQATFDRQQIGDEAPSADLVRRLDAAAAERGARTVLVARDGEGRAHSASFYLHDERCTWYLLGGSDTELRSSGSASLVMWTAIEQAAARGNAFDFEGSMLRHVERFVRAFGGTPTPYSIVHATPSAGFRRQRALKRSIRGMRR